MTKRGPQVCTTISPATRATIDRLTREYGTIREVLTIAVALLAAEARPLTLDDYDRLIQRKVDDLGALFDGLPLDEPLA